MKARETWLYTLNQNQEDDYKYDIGIYNNAGQIKIKRFVFELNGDDMLEECIYVDPKELEKIIHQFFERKAKKIKKVLESER